jgi:Fe-S-cluster-containing hydrogenase component 2
LESTSKKMPVQAATCAICIASYNIRNLNTWSRHSRGRYHIPCQDPYRGKSVVGLSILCPQCEEAPCVWACLTGALARDPMSSWVRGDEEWCIGYWACLLVYPLGAIRQGTQQEKVLKCDIFWGEDITVCASNYPNEALTLCNDHGLVQVTIESGTRR